MQPRRESETSLRSKAHVADVMASDVKTINGRDSAEHAWQTTHRGGIPYLIVKRKDAIVGVLSARELGGPGGDAFRVGRRADELMVRTVATAQPSHTVRQAAVLMRHHSLACLPVVSRGKLVGIVTNTDLVDLIARGDYAPAPVVVPEHLG